mgnify:CR=1 FL=1
MNKNLTLGNSKIASLFDEGTFVEIGAYIKRCGCADNYDGVICGYGSISGKLAFAFLQDSDRLKGAFDKTGAKKIAMLSIKSICESLFFSAICKELLYLIRDKIKVTRPAPQQ